MIDYLVYYGTLGMKQSKTYYGVSGADLQQLAIFGAFVKAICMMTELGYLIPYYNINYHGGSIRRSSKVLQ